MPDIPKSLAAYARESLALSFALALRNALEDTHAKHGQAHGFGHDTIVPMNKRVAHHCFTRIREMDPNDVLRSADAAQWAEDVWRVGVLDPGVLAATTVPAEEIAAARAQVAVNLAAHLAAFRAFVDMPTDQTRRRLADCVPSGWDSPALPPSA